MATSILRYECVVSVVTTRTQVVRETCADHSALFLYIDDLSHRVELLVGFLGCLFVFFELMH